jgi:ABC-type transport system involved in cytochrome c biogenesis permease subunit
MILRYLGCMEMDLDMSLCSGARNWSNFVAPICKLYAFIFYMLTFVVHIILACVRACVVGQEG